MDLLFLAPSLSAWLDASRAAETDRHLIAVDDHRHGTAPAAVPQHALEPRRALLDVDVLERNVPPLKVVTGGLCVGSSVFAKDVDHGDIVGRHRLHPLGVGGTVLGSDPSPIPI